MNKTWIFISMLLSVLGVRAASITDDFDRENMPQRAYTANVGGTGWTQAGDGSTGSDWFINGKTLVARPRDGSAYLYNTALETQSGNGVNFTLRADVRGLVGNLWTGVIFNYIDEGSYYLLRFKTGSADYQLIQKSGEKITVVKSGRASGIFAVDADYTLTVTSDTEGVFNFKIDATGAGNVVGWTHADDSDSALTGGYAGLYSMRATAHTARFDNFSLDANQL